MDQQNFREAAHQVVDWIADYWEGLESLPVKSQVKPGEILTQIPEHPPASAEPFEQWMGDVDSIILPGMTHWQHPSFHAYFPGNSSPPSVLAEMMTAAMGAQCMVWDTSPAAAELEERMMEWLGEMIGLSSAWTGVIQDSASTATLCAILTTRERSTQFKANEEGLTAIEGSFAVYASSEIHSSIEKAVKIAGLGAKSLRKIEVDEAFAMKPEALAAQIQRDLDAGVTPLCIVAAVGTTSSTAMDPLKPIADIAQQHNIWLHVDAAYAGTAAILPEKRWILDGVEGADSLVFNPHKWMFTNFDCSAYFVKDPQALVNTFAILPEYLKTQYDAEVKNYRDWGVPLGRRFRALKLWFVIRAYGVEGIQAKLRHHMELTQYFWQQLQGWGGVELMAPIHLNLVCFRFKPNPDMTDAETDAYNEGILKALNTTGAVYLTHTKLNGKYTLRVVIGQTHVGQHHVERLLDTMKQVIATGKAGNTLVS